MAGRDPSLDAPQVPQASRVPVNASGTRYACEINDDPLSRFHFTCLSLAFVYILLPSIPFRKALSSVLHPEVRTSSTPSRARDGLAI